MKGAHKDARKAFSCNTLYRPHMFNRTDEQGKWDHLRMDMKNPEGQREPCKVLVDESQHDVCHLCSRANELQSSLPRSLHKDDSSAEKWTLPGSAQDVAFPAYSLQTQTTGDWETVSVDACTEGRGISVGNVLNYRNQNVPLTNVKRGPRRAAMLSQQSSQILSPLILSPYEDIDRVVCPFTLEDPLHSEEQHRKKRKQMGISGRHRFNKADSHVPFHGTSLGRLKTVETDIIKDWRSQNRLVSSASTSKRTSQGSFLGGAGEVSSSDELDIFDRPKNVHSLRSSSSEKQKQRCVFAGSNRRSSEFQKELKNCLQGSNLNDMQSTQLNTFMSSVTDAGNSSTGEASGALDGDVGLKSRPMKEAGNAAESSVADQGSPSTNGMELAVFIDRPSRSLSQKYRPQLFKELVGQDLVAQALSSAVLKGKIAPVYLFHGSRGTGKTSTARILAAALNCCMVLVERRPCTFCIQCRALALGKSSGVWEVDAASHNGVDSVWALLQSTLSTPSSMRYKVFIIDECHMLTDGTWNALLKFLEEPPGDFVFILITTEPDRLPRTASSRCQKFSFLKIKHSDILKRLSTLVTLERLDVEYGVLDIIASRSDGSLRDAEMTLDLLSLSGQSITYSAVLDLVGSVSDEKLLHLLDSALCSDTVSTVQKAKELVDSGVEPLDLMTRLARLITDILVGNRKLANGDSNQFVSRHTCTKEGLEGLRAALKILLEAEKQLQAAHHDRTAWLTAALLQFGRQCQPSFVLSSSTSATTSPSLHKSFRNMKLREPKGVLLTKWLSTRSILNKMSPHSEHGNYASTFKPKARLTKANLETRIHPTVYPFSEDPSTGVSIDSSEVGSSPLSSKGSEKRTSFLAPGNLGNVWISILKGCKSLPLRHLLSHGKLLAVCFSAVEAMVHLEFKDPEKKSKAERYKKVIANTCKKGMGLSVNVKISLASQPVGEDALSSPVPLLAEQTLVGQDCFESLNAGRSECGILAESCNTEAGSLHHWRSQSGISSHSTMEHAYMPHSMPYHNAAMSSLTLNNRDRLSAFGGCLEVSRSEAFCSQERRETTWVFEANELSPLKAGYQQESPLPREHRNVVRYSEIMVTEPALTSNSADVQQAQQSVYGSTSPGHKVEKKSEVHNLEEENLRLSSGSRYGGLLCWMAPKAKEVKALQVGRQSRRRKYVSLITCMPCVKTNSQ
eukprot:c20500_g1_i3 orf=303-3869(-)